MGENRRSHWLYTDAALFIFMQRNIIRLEMVNKRIRREAVLKRNNSYYRASEKFNQQVEVRTYAALKEKHLQFVREHEGTNESELLEYVKACAKDLGHTPNMTEVIGGNYIAYRFQGWSEVIRRTGLPKPGTAPDSKHRKIYKDEYQRQIRLLKQEKNASREKRKEAKEERAEAARAEKEAKRERDMAWGEEHKSDTDEQLLAYVRECAETLGYSPFCREVVGGSYIAERLVCWPLVLELAGLPMAQGMKPSSQAKRDEYRRRQKMEQTFSSNIGL